jgi:Tol biopolymer transport system component
MNGLRPSTGPRAVLAAYGVLLLLVFGARWLGGIANAEATVLAVAGMPWRTYLGGQRLFQVSELYLVDVNTGLETRLDLRLSSPVPPNFDRLAWSPDNRWLAYVASEPDIFPESPGLLLDGLFIMDFQTLVARLYLQDVDRESDLVWSPDGARLVVAAHVAGAQASDIFLVEAESREVRNLSNDPGRDVWPQWMADGRAVVFLSDREGDWDVVAVDAASGEQRNLTQHPAQDRAMDAAGSPLPDAGGPLAVAPVGSKVAFVSNRDSAGDLFAVDAITGETRKLAAVGGEIAYLSWSPGGGRLAFSTRQTYDGPAAPDEVYVLDVASGALTNVSQAPDARDVRPLWAGGDQALIFNSDRDGVDNWEIYLADLAAGTLRNLTSGATTPPDAVGNDLLSGRAGSPVGGWQPFSSTRQAGRLFVVHTRSGEVRGLDINGQIFAGWNP